MHDLSRFFPEGGDETAKAESASLSGMAQGLVSSKILVIAYAVRARIEAGDTVANFTVGDFSPQEFAIPAALRQYVEEALRAGETNYPPADGVLELRQAVADHYRAHLGLDYPLESVVVASGTRPSLYAIYRCLIDPGEKVITPAPSWNNKNFCHLVGAHHVTVPTRPEDGFMPTAESLRPHLDGARMLVLCSPMNPTGTLMRENQMRAISAMVLEENARREATGKRLLYVVFDQVYRLLTFGDHKHVTPVGVAPEMARYTFFADAISKCFAATGLRVGWSVGPPFLARRVKAMATHIGAWAPRPEQVATARLLSAPDLVDEYLTSFRAALRQRLDLLYDAFSTWKKAGMPIDVIAPEGALYLSVKFDLEGRTGLPDDDAVRLYLLKKAGCAIVPFSAFGDEHNRGWVRFSVGAVSPADIQACLPRLRQALAEAVVR